MARKTPTVWVAFSGNGDPGRSPRFPTRTERAIRLESAGWWAWLERAEHAQLCLPDL